MAGGACLFAPAIVFPQAPPSIEDSFWGDNEITYLATNALVSGIGAGLTRAMKGGSFLDGFLGGALGGTVGYAGKRIAAKRFDGAGLIGREVGAFGASLTRNAAEGLGTLDHLYFPLGPFHIHRYRTDGETRWTGKIDALAALTAGLLMIHGDARVDWAATASTGGFVFRSDRTWFLDEEEGVAGQSFGRTIILRENVSHDLKRTLGHERVHLLQADFVFHTLGDPLETRLASTHPFTRRINEVLDFGVVVPSAFAALTRGMRLRYVDRPTEAEALFMAAR